MNETCGDNRFEIIESAKQRLIDATNIESKPEEMAVIDSLLFRMWQMGWLPGQELTCKYDYFQDAREANWLDKVECQGYHVLECGHRVPGDYFEPPSYCVVCGKKVKR